MTVSTFKRVILFHPVPFIFRKFTAMGLEFLPCVDRAEELAPDFLGGLHLAGDLVRPVMGDVTVRTGCPDAGTVGIMDGRFQFRIDIFTHFVTPDTELFRVGDFQGGVETTPENDAGNETANGQKAEAVVNTGLR